MKEFIVLVLLLAGIMAGNVYDSAIFTYDVSTFLIFILVVGFLIYHDRRKVKLQGIVLMRRTQKGKNFIDKTANKLGLQNKKVTYWLGQSIFIAKKI